MKEKKFKHTDKNPEKKDCKNYPVEVEAIRIKWFINSIHGKRFLNEILNSENLEIYNSNTIRMVIVYLYKRFND
jgi:hypothetical protein